MKRKTAGLSKVKRDSTEYRLYDFWMSCDEIPDIGPCKDLGRRIKPETTTIICDKTRTNILKSLDSVGKGEILTKVLAEYIQETNRELERYGNHISDSADQVHNLSVTNVRYITANIHGPQEIISFLWKEFDKMGRPKLLREKLTIKSEYSEIEKISREYLK